MNVGKLGSGGDLTSDTCNAAKKTHWILLVEKVCEAASASSPNNILDGVCVLEVDCWNRLQNVWLGNLIKALSI